MAKQTADRIESRRKQLIEAERIAKEIDKIDDSTNQQSMSGFYEQLGKRIWEAGKVVVLAQLHDELANVLAADPDAEIDTAAK